MHNSLMQRWVDLCPHPDLGDVLAVFDTIEKYYSEGWREYHDLGHIYDGFSKLDKYFPNATVDVRVAWMFHDLFQVPGRHDNEYVCKLMLFELCHMYASGGSYFPTYTLLQAGDHICATQRHEATTRNGKIVCDIDLLSLADDADIYDANTHRIRREYSAFTDEEWALGRRMFIDRFLRRPAIFQTEEIYSWFETAARSNLERERLLYPEVN